MTFSFGVFMDLVTEFIYNGANFLLGYTVSNGALVAPTKTGWTVAVLTGLVGAANHWRALRKQPAA